MLLFYIRHGDPDYKNDSLTPKGDLQAMAVAKRLAAFGIDEVYSSSLGRAMRTAKPTCDLLGLTAKPCDWATENRAWEHFTVTTDEGICTWCFFDAKYRRLLNAPEVRALGDKWYEHPCFEGTKFKEGVVNVSKDIDDFMLSLGFRHDTANRYFIPEKENNKRIALFSHQGFATIFHSCILDIPYPLFASHFDICHSGMSVIDFSVNSEGLVVPNVLEYSSDGHILKEGLPQQYNYGYRF